jgi:hypothetical protein
MFDLCTHRFDYSAHSHFEDLTYVRMKSLQALVIQTST